MEEGAARIRFDQEDSGWGRAGAGGGKCPEVKAKIPNTNYTEQIFFSLLYLIDF